MGGFNDPKFTWNDCVPFISPNCKYTNQYEDFSELLNEFDLTQIVTHPTRNENILDLFLIANPTLVKSVEVRPDIADHDSVLSEVFIKTQISRQKPRLMFIYKKADWEGLETHMLAYQKSVTCLATDASLTTDPGVASSIPAWSHTFVEIDHEIISTVILLPSAESFKKGCCQLQAKVCARSTG